MSQHAAALTIRQEWSGAVCTQPVPCHSAVHWLKGMLAVTRRTPSQLARFSSTSWSGHDYLQIDQVCEAWQDWRSRLGYKGWKLTLAAWYCSMLSTDFEPLCE